MSLDQYMKENFPDLTLEPPLFYNGDIGIRFELGVNDGKESIHENPSYLEGVYKRVVTLFEAVHSPVDDVYIVADVYKFGDRESCGKKPNIFSKYIKGKANLFKLQHRTIPCIFLEDDEEETYSIDRYSLKCKIPDFTYIPLLKAICNQDMGVSPRIFHRVYFINASKNTIFHVYDDRGCDLLASRADAIRDIYVKYNEWILDYDRDRIDVLFKEDQ